MQQSGKLPIRDEYDCLGRHNSLRPSNDHELTQAVAVLILFGGAHNIQFEDKVVEALYRETLRDIPGDLLLPAVKAVTMETTDTFRMPLPGIIREKVNAEIERRRAVHHQHQLSQQYREEPIDTGPRMPTAELNALMAETKRQLAAATPLTPIQPHAKPNSG